MASSSKESTRADSNKKRKWLLLLLLLLLIIVMMLMVFLIFVKNIDSPFNVNIELLDAEHIDENGEPSSKVYINFTDSTQNVEINPDGTEGIGIMPEDVGSTYFTIKNNGSSDCFIRLKFYMRLLGDENEENWHLCQAQVLEYDYRIGLVHDENKEIYYLDMHQAGYIKITEADFKFNVYVDNVDNKFQGERVEIFIVLDIIQATDQIKPNFEFGTALSDFELIYLKYDNSVHYED